jgi:hypothetical protein
MKPFVSLKSGCTTFITALPGCVCLPLCSGASDCAVSGDAGVVFPCKNGGMALLPDGLFPPQAANASTSVKTSVKVIAFFIVMTIPFLRKAQNRHETVVPNALDFWYNVFEKTGTLRERVEVSAFSGLPLFRIVMCAGRSFKHK